MTAVSSLTTWCVLSDGSTHWPDQVAVTLDETWAPMVSADVRIPWVDGVSALLDPRVRPRILVGIRRSWHYSAWMADLTAAWAGHTMADLTAAWAGHTMADLTAAWREQWESGWRAPDELVCDLVVRTSRTDHGAGTVTVRATSDELLAQDSRVILSATTEPLPQRIRGVLAAAGIPVLRHDLTAGAIYIAMPPVVTDMTTTVWDTLSSAATSAALRLACDHTRTWRLIDPSAPPTTTATVTRATVVDDEIDVDSGWADVLVITMTGPILDPTASDGSTVTITASVTYPDPVPPGPHVVHHEAITLPDATPAGVGLPLPTTAEMAARLDRLQSLGRVMRITAPADPTLRPGTGLTTGPPSLPETTARLSAITYRIPEDTMTITTRSTAAL